MKFNKSHLGAKCTFGSEQYDSMTLTFDLFTPNT